MVKLYFPVFLLGAVFGKLIEFAGFLLLNCQCCDLYGGPEQSHAMIILVCALLTYGGVSLFVVAFANLFFTWLIPHIYGDQFMINLPGLKKPL
ncbi:membrane protein [Salmonella enterica subsp. enterica]|nr:membrane protein [Salmonella enterica subsp. enterica]